MKTYRFKDLYNDRKYWWVKHSTCGHYYYAEEINGCRTKFVRMNKRMLSMIFDWVNV